MIIVLSTYPDRKSAETAATMMVEQELAACVNIVKIEGSVYRWEGKVVKSGECLLVIKTTNYRPVESYILKNHPHKVPEIIQLEVSDGSRDYLSWVRGNSAPSPFKVPLERSATRRASRPSRASINARKPRTSSR